MTMDGLQRLRIFVNVIQKGNMSSAGRHLGLSPASVSRHVSALEQALGCRLINRTSRKVALTEAGELYYARIEQILQQISEANHSVAQLQSRPSGILRVHSRTLVGHLHIVPILPAFLSRYPEIHVDLLLSNRVVGLTEENIDVDIRIGKLVDSSLAARKLGSARRVLCATPEYLRLRPPLKCPSDLAHHNCLTYRINVGRAVWRFLDRERKLEEVQVTGSFQTDNGLALHAATLAGVGIALMPDWSVRGELAGGQLVRLLPEYDVSHIEFDNGVYAVFQKSPLISAKVRAFVDFLAVALAERFEQAPAQPTSLPPSTGSTTPVTKAASADAR
jgi:DNA-binding transcriptional LysR family regulator